MDEARKTMRLAASEGDFAKAKELLESNQFPVDISLGEGVFSDRTLLAVAAAHGQTECVRAILQYGEDLYTRGSFNGVRYVKIADDYVNAIISAAAAGHTESLLVLAGFRYFPNDLDKTDYYTDLVKATKEGLEQRIEYLMCNLEDKASTLKGWKGHNIMNMCLLCGCSSRLLQTIIGHGVGVNGWDFNGLSPLMCAILGKNLECVQYLIEHGACVRTLELFLCMHFENDGTVVNTDNASVRYNRTTLMYATCVGDIQILKEILQSVTLEDINRQESWHGYWSLMYAVMTGNKEVVSLLLENGADMNLTDQSNQGPLCMAVIHGHTELVHFFLDEISSIDQIYEAATVSVWKQNVKYLDFLIKSCDGAICRDEYEGKLLEDAIDEDSLECAQFLIENGHCRSGAVDSALVSSCRNQRVEFVEYLLKYGVDLNTTDKEGTTAIRWAVKRKCPICLRYLLDAGAGVDITDRGGHSIFSDAVTGDADILEMLLKTGLLLQNRELKNVHKTAIESLGGAIHFPLKSVLLLMRHSVFQWEWCLQAVNVDAIVFAAVSEGYSPVKCIKDNTDNISLIHLAMTRNKTDALLYLLVNLYFLPGDFQILQSDQAKPVLEMSASMRGPSTVADQITSQPLSLQTWSFLIVSNALSCGAENVNERAGRVESLPLPTRLRRDLAFHGMFSRLCPSQWKRICSEIKDEHICNLIMDKHIWKTPLGHCPPECCACVGFGKTFCDHDT